MQAFVWDALFVTGLDRVDEQHHRLVDLINQIGESLIDGDPADSLESVFARLADYAKYHFAEEERLMAEVGVAPRYIEVHRQRHSEFMHQVTGIWATRTMMRNPAETLHRYLIAWLSFHVLREDQDMARQIASIRNGETPVRSDETNRAPQDPTTHALVAALSNLYQVLSEQNRDLASANVRLEERVAQRTRALVAANQQLQRVSRTDGLLQIANRMHFNERYAEEWGRAQRDRESIALLMLDVDHFKRFNDTYGHQEGDRCLQAVAQLAASVVRRPADLAARYGGEELVIMLPNTEALGARDVALNICAQLVERKIPHSASPVADHVTVSIGVAATIPAKNSPSGQLIAAADRALYRAKDAGRNQVWLD